MFALSWMRHLPAANPVMIASGALPSDVPPEFRTWPTAPVCRSNVKPRAGMGWPNKSRPLYLQLRPMVQSFRMAVRGLKRWFRPPLCGHKKLSRFVSAKTVTTGRFETWGSETGSAGCPPAAEISIECPTRNQRHGTLDARKRCRMGSRTSNWQTGSERAVREQMTLSRSRRRVIK